MEFIEDIQGIAVHIKIGIDFRDRQADAFF